MCRNTYEKISKLGRPKLNRPGDDIVRKKSGKYRPAMKLALDRFQLMKKERMQYLLEELEEKKEVKLSEFLSSIAIQYGIRKATGLEYIQAWVDGGYVSVQGDVIRFLKKPEEWK